MNRSKIEKELIERIEYLTHSPKIDKNELAACDRLLQILQRTSNDERRRAKLSAEEFDHQLIQSLKHILRDIEYDKIKQINTPYESPYVIVHKSILTDSQLNELFPLVKQPDMIRSHASRHIDEAN